MFVINKSICPWQPLRHSLMFVVSPGAYPSGAAFSFSPLGKALCLTCKH